MDKNRNSNQHTNLRKRAEDILRRKPEEMQNIPTEDIQSLIHELQTHQIELDMQNDELLRTQQELSISRDQYLELYDLAPVGYFNISEKFLIQNVNLTGANLIGINRNKLLNKPFTRFIFPDDQDKYYFFHRKAFQTKILQSDEIRMVKDDGSIFYASLSCIAFGNMDGADELRITITDITQHIPDVEKLFQEKDKIRQYFESSPDAIIVTDLDGFIVECNKSTLSIHGFDTREEIIGRNVLDLIAPQDRDKAMINTYKTLEQNFVRDIEYICLTKDGREFPAELSVGIIRDSYGNPTAFVGITKDITERKRIEDELVKSEDELATNEARYRDVIARAGGVAYQRDWQSGTYTFMDSGIVNLTGYSVSEITPKIFMSLIEEEISRDRIGDKTGNNKIHRLIGGITTIYQGEYRIKTRDNKTKFVSDSSIQIRNADGRIVQTIGMLQDITERKQAEEKLIENEERYRNIIANAGGVAYQRDWQNGIYTFMDEGIKQLTGYSNDEITPKLFVNLCENSDVYDKKIIHSGVSHQIGEGGFTLYQAEYHIRSRQGQVKYILDSSLELRDNDNNIIQSSGMLQDITERKQVEEQLRASETKYRTLFNNLADAVSILDMEGRFLEVNDAYVERLGYSREELLNMNAKDINILEYAEILPERLEQLRDERLKNFETIHVTKDGRRIPVEVGGKRIEYNGIPAILSIVRDITERKRAEEELQNSEERLRDIIFSMGDWVWEVDENGVYTYSSQKGFDILGFSSENIIGKTPFDFMSQDEAKRVAAIFSEIAANKAPIKDLENWNIAGDGKRICLLTNGVPILDKDGNLKGYRGVDKDITERKKTEELQEKLQQASKMESIGRLAGGVAHDFNNLLTVIQGSVELGIKGLNKHDPLYDRLKMIDEASERAEDLTRQLLAFSRKQTVETKVINLNNVINNLQKMLVRLIGENIELHTMLSKDIGNIKADAGQIEQIIVNLSVNAKDAMPDGGKLAIDTANVELDEAYCQTHTDIQPGKYVMLTVSDNGSGMDDATKEHIFEPFFTTKDIGEGTGLGLATIYGIVKQHNGSIDFYSELCHGTTFKIYLPIVEDEVSAQSQESEKAKMLVGNDTILVVEDESIVRELAVQFLKYLGYNVLSAANGDMALIMSKQHKGEIHLMLTDIVMPGINGYQLVGKLQRERPEMKVLYTSGYTRDVIAQHGILDEGINFIGKPYKLDALAKKIRDVLGK